MAAPQMAAGQEQQVDLEQVGLAEDVLRRLIAERRSLENAAAVLETYRMVRSQLGPLTAQVQQIQGLVTERQEQLASLDGQLVKRKHEISAELTQYRIELDERVQREIEVLVNVKVALESDVALLDTLVKQEQLRYSALVEEHNAALTHVRQELEKVQRQHAVISEAIGKAAGFFMPVPPAP